MRQLWLCFVVLGALAVNSAVSEDVVGSKRHAYAAMMYMGTPRDYEFYVALRVMMRSLARLKVDADRVVIASADVPAPWVKTIPSYGFCVEECKTAHNGSFSTCSKKVINNSFTTTVEKLLIFRRKEEDGVNVVTVQNLKNPYENGLNSRFKLTMNKLYAWSLVSYERVVMLDSDNIFLQLTDELFQCGQFCAVFIHPCYFHTGLFVLQPSMDVFNDMVHELEIERKNDDGADQGFLISYFPDLLDRPMFYPPVSGSKLDGTYRLPLGYQMDASYYYLKLRWHIPCGPNSVITFPSLPWLKPWYWWSWPLLPLGLSWHEQRQNNLGYSSEMPVLLIQAVMYLGIFGITRLARPNLSKLCYNRRPEKSLALLQATLKLAAILCIFAAYIVPFFLIPRTVHPILGWLTYLLGVASLSSIVICVFLLPPFPVLSLLFGMLGSLFVMAFPWYSSGITRALTLFGYVVVCTPFIWASFMKVLNSLQSLLDREAFFPRLGESTQLSEFNKLY